MQHSGGRTVLVALAALAVGTVLAAGCSDSDDGPTGSGTDDSSPAAEQALVVPLSPLTAERGAQPRIVDDEGRQVLLRGINLNSLGEYAQANPELEQVVPLTEDDWREMAAQGFDVVRLLVSWSALEPERGEHDEAYLAQIETAVRAAEAQGIYTVVDVHQDAWGPTIGTPDGTDCPEGLEPAVGWDGTPEWATLTEGEETCIGSGREDSDAVRATWDAFYADEEGIQSALVDTWAWLAGAFADDPAVAGFDLLNEPGNGSDPAAAPALLGEYFDRAIDAIREAEVEADGFAHPIFFEYTVDGQAVPVDFSDDPGLVFAPHVYGGSIAPVPLEVNVSYVEGLAADYETALWIGEHGWFDDPEANAAAVQQYGRFDDELFAGGAWWQWRQACGDPHSVGEPGGVPAETYLVYHEMGCPPGEPVGDDLGVVAAWAEVLTRPYPRATPGRLTSLTSDGAAGTMALTAEEATAGAELDLWVPGSSEPGITGTGVAGVAIEPVDGGHRVRVEVCGPTYAVAVGDEAGAPLPDACGAAAAS